MKTRIPDQNNKYYNRRDTKILHLPFEYSGRPNINDRFGWPVDRLSDYLVFDWADGDGTTPLVGTTLTANGTITTGQKTPCQRVDGSKPTAAKFDPGAYNSLHSQSLAANEDVLLLVVVDSFNIDVTGGTYELSFFDTFLFDPAFTVYTYSGLVVARAYGSSTVTVTGSLSRGFCLIGCLCDRDGNVSAISSSGITAGGASPALADNSNMGFQIGINTYLRGSTRVRALTYKGVGLADLVTSDFISSLSNHVFGIGSQNGPVGTFDRGSIATKVSDSKLFFFGLDVPCAGDENGLLLEPPMTQKVYRNYDPAATTGLTATGGMTLAVVADDESDLAGATVDLTDLGPAVFRAANSTGSTQYVYSTPTTGNTNVHSLSVYGRIISGSANLGLYDQSAGTFSNDTALLDSYARTEQANQTPPDTDCSWALEIPDGAEIYFVGMQLEECWVCTSFIPNNLTAATVSRVMLDWDSGSSLNDDLGTVTFSFKTNFTGTAGSTLIIFPVAFCYILSGNNYFRTYDGTNQAIVSSVNVCDGNWHDIKVQWDSSRSIHVLTVDGVSAQATYDGSWGFVNFAIGHVTNPSCYIKNLRVSRG